MTGRDSPPEGPTGSRVSWLVHDLVVGVLAGGFVGFVTWIMLVARFIGSPVVGSLFLALGAAAGIVVLRRERRSRDGIGGYTIGLWGALVFAIVWFGTLIWALSNFN
jgi:hypothetical protein